MYQIAEIKKSIFHNVLHYELLNENDIIFNNAVIVSLVILFYYYW